MLFKNNVETTEIDQLLIRALIETSSIEILYEQMPEFKEDLSLSLKSLSNKLESGNQLEDLLYEIHNLNSIRSKKTIIVEKKDYEGAARLRDDEKSSEKKIGLRYYRRSRKTNSNSDVDELREYFMSLDSEISEKSNIKLLVEPGTATKEDIGNLLSELSKLYRMLGGSGINFKLEGISNPKYKFDYE